MSETVTPMFIIVPKSIIGKISHVISEPNPATEVRIIKTEGTDIRFRVISRSSFCEKCG